MAFLQVMVALARLKEWAFWKENEATKKSFPILGHPLSFDSINNFWNLRVFYFIVIVAVSEDKGGNSQGAALQEVNDICKWGFLFFFFNMILLDGPAISATVQNIEILSQHFFEQLMTLVLLAALDSYRAASQRRHLSRKSMTYASLS